MPISGCRRSGDVRRSGSDPGRSGARRRTTTLALDLERLDWHQAASRRAGVALFRCECRACGTRSGRCISPTARWSGPIVGLLPTGPIERPAGPGNRHRSHAGGHGRSAPSAASASIIRGRCWPSLSANLETAGKRNWQIRHGDLYQLPFAGRLVRRGGDPPGAALFGGSGGSPGGGGARPAPRAVALLIVDFAPHDVGSLREEHAHRWLGFADEQVEDWLRECGFKCAEPDRICRASR